MPPVPSLEAERMRGWIAGGPQRTPPPDAWKLDPQGIHNRARDLVLNLEHVGEVPFVFLPMLTLAINGGVVI